MCILVIVHPAVAKSTAGWLRAHLTASGDLRSAVGLHGMFQRACAGRGVQDPAPAALAVAVTALYPQVPAFRSASTACAAVISGVV
jgi:hypothetical protein